MEAEPRKRGRPKVTVNDPAEEYRRITGRDPERDATLALWGAAPFHLALWRRKVMMEGIDARREGREIPVVRIDEWCVFLLGQLLETLFREGPPRDPPRRMRKSPVSPWGAAMLSEIRDGKPGCALYSYLQHPAILGPGGVLHAMGCAGLLKSVRTETKKDKPSNWRRAPVVKVRLDSGRILGQEKHRHAEQLGFYLNLCLVYLAELEMEPEPQWVALLAAAARLGGDDDKPREDKHGKSKAPIPVGEYVPGASAELWGKRIAKWKKRGYVQSADTKLAAVLERGLQLLGNEAPRKATRHRRLLSNTTK